jgi:hypothetical protein
MMTVQFKGVKLEWHLIPPRGGFLTLRTCQAHGRKSRAPRQAVSQFGQRTRVPGSVSLLNPLEGISDEGVADDTRGRVCSPKTVAGHAWLSN